MNIPPFVHTDVYIYIHIHIYIIHIYSDQQRTKLTGSDLLNLTQAFLSLICESCWAIHPTDLDRFGEISTFQVKKCNPWNRLCQMWVLSVLPTPPSKNITLIEIYGMFGSQHIWLQKIQLGWQFSAALQQAPTSLSSQTSPKKSHIHIIWVNYYTSWI